MFDAHMLKHTALRYIALLAALHLTLVLLDHFIGRATLASTSMYLSKPISKLRLRHYLHHKSST